MQTTYRELSALIYSIESKPRKPQAARSLKSLAKLSLRRNIDNFLRRWYA